MKTDTLRYCCMCHRWLPQRFMHPLGQGTSAWTCKSVKACEQRQRDHRDAA